jgi:hypothetical protein
MVGSIAALPAHAADKAECVNAYSKAQSLRDAHQLASAREQLRICARPVCTQFIVQDCTSWLADVEPRIPSVVLAAKDANGSELADVTVSLDGKVFAQKLDGRSMELDPGQHTFSFVSADGRKVETSILVLEGQKARPVAVAFAAPKPVAAGAPASPPAVTSPPEGVAPVGHGSKTLAFALGGVGLGGMVVGGIFGALAMSRSSKAKDECSPTNCPSTAHDEAVVDHDAASQAATISTIGFVAGGALAALGAILLLKSPSEEAKGATAGALGFEGTLGQGSFGAAVRGKF